MPQPDVLGRNGSYVGLRKYQSRVGAFNRFLRANGNTEQERELLAAKLVGRWKDGSSLVRHPYKPRTEEVSGEERLRALHSSWWKSDAKHTPDAEKTVSRPTTSPKEGSPIEGAARSSRADDNDFLFGEEDPEALRCPYGSHIRRANPRDGLAKDLASAQTLLDAANNHRMLRRGRKYGPPPADRHTDDGVERGLLFICLNADIARQFEFVQQTWILNRNFATLYDETDPLVGPKGGFTIGEKPLRRIVDVETFIQSAGGEYFFLPSLPALKYLASL
jgi:Dyp-type peroxidase family